MTNHTEQTLEMVEEQLDRDYRIRTHSFELLEELKRLVENVDVTIERQSQFTKDCVKNARLLITKIEGNHE